MLLAVDTLPSENLPIFRQDEEAYSLFYAPGYLAVVARRQADAFLSGIEASQLRQHARAAIQARKQLMTNSFAPVCLTLYLNNECNLRCSYCYTDPSPRLNTRLDLATIRAAAQLVAKNCCQQKRPFTIVCHGGGEPTLDQPYLEKILVELEQIARQHELSIFRYIATNGVMRTDKARWVAKRFDLIGLSCDGPEKIQTKQRPLWGGQSSTSYIERIAHIIHKQGTPLHVRTTITRQSICRQPEIAQYLCQELQPQEIHVEPVYQAGRANADACLQDADSFVNEFLEAQTIARQYGLNWLMSGSRLNEIHGPFCHIFRDVLNLIPGGVATACFKTTRCEQAKKRGIQIGEIGDNGRFHLAHSHISSLRQSLNLLPTKCQDCFNQYHCVQDCPNHCPLDSTATSSVTFRCLVQKKLAQSRLETLAKALWAQAKQKNGFAEIKVTRW